MPDIKPFLASILQQECWRMDGTPLGDWPPLTNVPPVSFFCMDYEDAGARCDEQCERCAKTKDLDIPPTVKPEVDDSGEEVKPYKRTIITTTQGQWDELTTRIAALEDMVREFRNDMLGRVAIWNVGGSINDQKAHDLIRKSENLVP